LIRIHRSACPATLAGRTEEGTHYNKAEVVHALWEMQYGKCCYCEQLLPRRGHLKAVEHFRPKAIFQGSRNEWANLLLACAQCNGKKSDKFPTVLSDAAGEDKVLYLGQRPATLLDPSDPQIDPEDHLDFDFSGPEWVGDFACIMARDGSVLGTETIATIGLDGAFYTRMRRERYRRVILASYVNLLEALDGGDHDQVGIQRQSFELLMAAHKPFAGLARAFARFRRLDEPPVSLRIPRG
jgi:uncharacterized protein (TIGR02646 family)